MKKNYYWQDLNYIHLKFWDCRKAHNFTDDFAEKHPNFCKEYYKYFNYEKSIFKNPFDVIFYVFRYKLPVEFYFNYTDKPCKTESQAIKRLTREYLGEKMTKTELYNFKNWAYHGLDNEILN